MQGELVFCDVALHFVSDSLHMTPAFFSVQRLHGFRQVVTHVQLQQKDEL